MAETTLKTLIDKFRGRPEWQHTDPAVRAEAVLRLPASDRELILALAREDPDARVRRAAVKRIDELARRGWSDEDLGRLASGNILRVLRKAEEVATRLQKARPASNATIEELDGPR